MKNTKLIQLLAMIVASSTLGAKGLACIGSCTDRSDNSLIPLLPASSGDKGGAIPSESTETLCAQYCSGADSCKATSIAQPDGTSIPALHCYSNYTCGAGRRPPGMTTVNMNMPANAAQWLLQAAHLEAVSVDAFRLLRRDLRAHRAPRSMLRQASRAAREEKRHARRMRSLAKRAGIHFLQPAIEVPQRLTLEELALQNATEGCLRETLGAAMARFQALHASDPHVAAAMKSIAPDEAHHAALAHRVNSWVMRRLSPAARKRVEGARRQCALELLQNASVAPDFTTRKRLGLPDPCTAHALTSALLRGLRFT